MTSRATAQDPDRRPRGVTTPLRVAGYVRVSGQDQAEAGTIEAQDNWLGDQSERESWAMDLFEEPGRSGETIAGRPDLLAAAAVQAEGPEAAAAADGWESEATELRRRLDDLKARRAGVTRRYQAGLLTEEEYDEALAASAGTLRDLQARLVDVEGAIRDRAARQDAAAALRDRLGAMRERVESLTFEERRGVVEAVLRQGAGRGLYLKPDGTFVLVGALPDGPVVGFLGCGEVPTCSRRSRRA